MTTARELMSAVGPILSHTQPLKDVARRIDPGGTVLVLDLSGRPAGLISDDDLHVIAAEDPHGWTKKLCAALARPIQRTLQTDDRVDEVITGCQHGVKEPLLVTHGDDPVGILYPHAVREWCASQQHTTVGSLARPVDRQPGAQKEQARLPGPGPAEESA